MPADAKPVSATRLVMAQEMTPQDANPAGTSRREYHEAGRLGRRRGGHPALPQELRHRCRGPLRIPCPVFIGNLVTFHASVNYVGRTSMEVGVRVEAEEPRTGSGPIRIRPIS